MAAILWQKVNRRKNSEIFTQIWSAFIAICHQIVLYSTISPIKQVCLKSSAVKQIIVLYKQSSINGYRRFATKKDVFVAHINKFKTLRWCYTCGHEMIYP